MIGIFALAGWPQEDLTTYAQHLADGMATKPSWDVNVSVGQQVACGRVGPQHSDATWTSHDGIYKAWLDGVAFMLSPRQGHEGRRAGAGDLAMALLFQGPRALLDFHGEFFLLVLDESNGMLFAATDRFGVRTTYWHAEDRRLCICSELGLSVRLGLIPRKLDKPFVAALLRFNKCRLGDRTIFSGTSVVPAGTVQQFDLKAPSNPRHHVYYSHEFKDEVRTEDEWIEAIIPALRRATRCSLNASGGPTALALSGGLDSRMLLAASDTEDRKRLRLFSCGIAESEEVKLAAKTAAIAGGQYENINLGPGDFLRLARTSVRRNEEFDIFVQGAQAALHGTAAQQATALMTGWDIDIPLRGTYVDDRTFGLSNQADVIRTIEVKWGLYSRDELTGLLHESFYREAGDVPEEWLREAFSDLPRSTPLRSYLQFIFHFEKRRLLMLRNRMIRFELESLTPYYDGHLQLLLAGIPESVKVGNRLFAKLFVHLAPDLAALPYQRTMLPVVVPVEYWNAGSRLEDDRERLLLDISIKAGIRIPYVRHYSNFDEWLATDVAWRDFVTELLDSDKTLITQEVVKRTAVRRLLLEHRNGYRSHRAKLIYLLSLELYLREYFT
jgi:hypothetical protein